MLVILQDLAELIALHAPLQSACQGIWVSTLHLRQSFLSVWYKFGAEGLALELLHLGFWLWVKGVTTMGTSVWGLNPKP